MSGCISCPFTSSEESEYAQNTGCLPTAFEILEMKRKTGNNWACHYHPDRVCKGLSQEVDTSSGALINWLSAHGRDVNA